MGEQLKAVRLTDLSRRADKEWAARGTRRGVVEARSGSGRGDDAGEKRDEPSDECKTFHE
jgi:hypothetical protein